MDIKLKSKAEKIHKRYQRKKLWQRIVSALSCAVVFCTTYALILPAITQEREAFCGQEEHIHEDECYVRMDALDRVLICSEASLGLHVHNQECYDGEGKLICGQADYVAHSHAEHCFDQMGNLICTLPERELHVHTEQCYATQGGHVHGDDCYVTQRGALICAMEEDAGHTHTGSCYAPGETVLCQIPENHVHGDGCHAQVLRCQMAENHVHAEGCYSQTLTCTVEEGEAHTHGDECYTANLTCSLEENHVHRDGCFAPELICTIPEGHVHDAACMEQVLQCEIPETEGHTHGDACYEQLSTLVCTQEEASGEQVLICTEPQAQVHVHTEECFAEAAEPELTCSLPENEEHTHTQRCYGVWALNCMEQEHEHSLICYSDVEADVETAADWERTFKDVELTGTWCDDTLAIARTQLGYRESTKNYTVLEDGETMKGYTRYGAWYGIPYGDWCAMFVSFCMHYAEVEDITLHSSVGRWVAELKALDWYFPVEESTQNSGEPAEGYTPKPGDLVFFDWQGDGAEDHVGLVAELIPETEEEPAKIKTIEGNTGGNNVAYITYEVDNPVIAGYGLIPTYYCGLKAHVHTDACMDENGEPACGLEAHAHTEACIAEPVEEDPAELPEEEISPETPEEENETVIPADEVQTVIAAIDSLPTYDAVMAKLDDFYEAGDTEGEDAYLTGVYTLVEEAYRAYMALEEPLREQVTNADKLMELEFIWSRITLEEPVETEESQESAGETVYYCGMEAHVHAEDCYDVYGNRICALTEHTHDAACEAVPVYYCGKDADAEHIHDASCLIPPIYYCGLEDDPDHGHTDACLVSPYRCGLETHLHDESCADDCAVVEHVHTESCKEEPSYRCGYEEHRHSQGCYDADGGLVCEQTEHTHTDECLLIYYCGVVHEHVHSGCYVNFVHTCQKIGHEHFYLCTVKPQYCSETHIHDAACYNEDGVLTCTEHTHILSCWINPESSGTNTDPEGTFAGSNRFHSSVFQKYQASSHTISMYEVGVFALIPESANVNGWVPNTRQWTGDSNANYLVAYCSDDRTTSSKKGEGYETYTLNTSRFTNDDQRRKVAAIIGHSYPFLSPAQMRQQLEYAYAQGLTVDSSGRLIDIRDSVESDWIAATQWALWDTTTTMEAHPTIEVDIDDYGEDRPAAFPTQHERYCINPLTDPGYTDVEEARQKLEALHNWLMALQEPEALLVQNYTYEITENEDGSYKLTVDVILNRETVLGEHTVFQLSVGNRATAANELEVGTESFRLILDGITLQEIANARVHLNVDGKHMQAYFFDSFNYQDMIGGNWEYYSEDLSFDVAAELTNVTVYKKWTEGVPEDVDCVTVQLYADGKPYGDTVELSEANGWTYTWKDLNKCHISGTNEDGTVFGGDEIVYTIVESPVPGYYSSLVQVDGFAGAAEEEAPVTVTYWKEVDTFDGNGEYVLLSDVGALTASYFKNTYYMNVSPIDLSVVTEEQAASVWTATGTAEEGYKLASKRYPGAYMNYEKVGSVAGAKAYFLENGLFFCKSNTTNRYFRSFYSNGYQLYTSDPSLAMHFRLYKLTTETLEGSEINFLLTNSRIPEEATASVTIMKRWEGRRDTSYPLSATVTLMQDGRPYGDPVELNASNNWSYTWENLPYAMNGTRVEYSVEETPVPGYASAYEIQDNMNTDDRALILTLTNTWEPTRVPVQVRKVDADIPAILLSGARFDVYVVDHVAQEAALIPGTGYSGLKTAELTVPKDGVVYEFEAGEIYCLVETAAPDGYNLMAETIVLKVTESGITILSGRNTVTAEENTLTIANKAGYELPVTGGTGTIPYTAGGALLMMAACILLMYSHRKQRREDYQSS